MTSGKRNLCSTLLGCTNSEYKDKKINEFTNVKSSDITKIVFYDGRGGLN